jgi:rhodanese-related sulfurtransferase
VQSPLFEDISVEDYKARFKDGGEAHFLLDVRRIDEFEEVRIPGAVNIPLDQLRARIDEVEDAAGDNPIVVVCRTGNRSMMGAQILRYSGIAETPIFNLETGTMGWAKQQFPLESGE